MAVYWIRGAARAASLAFVFVAAVPVQAQDLAPTAARSNAATVWQLRSGLNVAALGCRGADEAAIVAGYNRLLADHRDELAGTYQAVSREYGSAAAFDAAMTRAYNGFAQPAAQAALCANALGVLDAMAAHPDEPLAGQADDALAQLQGAPLIVTQVAVASIPQIVDQRAVPASDLEDGIPDGE